MGDCCNYAMSDYDNELSSKIVRLLTPSESSIIRIFKDEVIFGKTDRATGKLVTEHGFTQEEAEWFVKKVQEIHGQKNFKK